MGMSPFWLVEGCSHGVTCEDVQGEGITVIRLKNDPSMKEAPFSDKVRACAMVEERAAGLNRTVVWMAADTPIVQPPLLADVGTSCDVAVRPVHVRNVGIPVGDNLDDFWQGVYDAAGVEDVTMEVETFVDRQAIRAYFNSHLCAAAPSRGLFREWLRVFRALTQDTGFLSTACSDELHQAFLHQAALGAVIAKKVPADRLRVLPQTYSYPYNLHESVPPAYRAKALDDLVTVVYEHRLKELVSGVGIGVGEPLRSLLSARSETPL